MLVPPDGQSGRGWRSEASSFRVGLRGEAAGDVEQELVDVDEVVPGFAGRAELLEVKQGVRERDESLDLAAQGLERGRGLGVAAGAQERHLELAAHQREW